MAGLSEDMFDDYNDIFLLFDKDRKGHVHTRTIKDMLKYAGYNPTDKQLEELTIVVDKNKNGRIEFDEFIDLTERLNTQEKATKEGKF